MTEMTELEAVRRLCAPLDEDAIISDGTSLYTPSALLKGAGDEVIDVLVAPGESIEVKGKGVGDYMSACRVKGTRYSYVDDIRAWVNENMSPGVAEVVERILSDPEKTEVRPHPNGREYVVFDPRVCYPQSEPATMHQVLWCICYLINSAPKGPAERRAIAEIATAMDQIKQKRLDDRKVRLVDVIRLPKGGASTLAKVIADPGFDLSDDEGLPTTVYLFSRGGKRYSYFNTARGGAVDSYSTIRPLTPEEAGGEQLLPIPLYGDYQPGVFWSENDPEVDGLPDLKSAGMWGGAWYALVTSPPDPEVIAFVRMTDWGGILLDSDMDTVPCVIGGR